MFLVDSLPHLVVGELVDFFLRSIEDASLNKNERNFKSEVEECSCNNNC